MSFRCPPFGSPLSTIFCRSGQVTGTTAIAKNGQSSVLDRGAASPDQKSFVARSPAVTLAAAAHHLAVPFFRLSGTFSGKSKWEQISGKLPPIGIGKAAPLVLSRSTFPIENAPPISIAVPSWRRASPDGEAAHSPPTVTLL